MADDATSDREGCLAAILRLLGVNRGRDGVLLGGKELPYRVRDDFLSLNEVSFYHILSSIVGSRAVICPKVRLADVFFVARRDEYLSHYNRIAQRHVDFLLCKPDSMKPFLGIELDDSSHSNSERRSQDEFVNQVFQTAGLSLLRVRCQREYNSRELKMLIVPYLEPEAEPSSPSAVMPAEQSNSRAGEPKAIPPICPKCGVPMVLRTAKRGANRGKQFYGCPNYPRCREVVTLDTKRSEFS